MIIEVLSKGTSNYDKRGKFAWYRRVPGLREYVLVSQDEPRIEVYRRSEMGIRVLIDLDLLPDR